ncbi:hypothetical protein ACP70R_045598 [Stipagrostis hirtigluma subsp. patula]
MAGSRRRKLDHDHLLDSPSSRRLKFSAAAQSHSTAPLMLLENLPEELLHKVISQLTVKEAGRTSILSSRWRGRWMYHSKLCFDRGSELAGYGPARFVDHITTVLQRHSRLVVDRFEVRSSAALGKQHADHLDMWFGFATASKAKHVVLDLSPPKYIDRIVANDRRYKLPADQLVNNAGSCNSSIVSLFLGHMCLELPSHGFHGFKTLRKLDLKYVADVGDLTLFLSNCPALEWLGIILSSIPHLVVPKTSCCLRYLRVYRSGLKSIELHAASLKTFEYVGMPFLPIKINHSVKLSQANIKLDWLRDTVGYFWVQLSRSLSHVDRLHLSLSMDTKKTRLVKNPTKFIHLRHLVLFCTIFETPKSALGVLRLTQVLVAAPQLEHFALHMNNISPEPYLLKTTDCIHPHVHHQLKTVYMIGVFGLLGQLELAKYILQSADALELMIISLGNMAYPDPDVPSQPNHAYFLELEKFAKGYLDPQGEYNHFLKIVGLN